MTTKSFPDAINLFDFFHERVDAAATHQRLQLSEEGLFYLTNLLVEKGHTSAQPGPDTLAELYLQARSGHRAVAIQQYRELGDRALYLSGFFRRSVQRGMMGVEYYLNMGAAAYHALSRLLDLPRRLSGHKDLGEIFGELSVRFAACSAVLSEVEQEVRVEAETHSDADILRLYERWMETGSPMVARRLQALGVLAIGGDSEPC